MRAPWQPGPHATKHRLAALLVVLLLLFVGVGIRLVDVQAMGREHYAALGADQRVRTVELAAERGTIFDRDGYDLALSVPQQTVWANPRVVSDPAAYAAALAPLVGGDEAELTARLADRTKGFVYVARKVDDVTALKVAGLGLSGVDFVPETKRFYPDGSLAAPVVGYVGTDNDGLGGLESQYESSLAGRPGKVSVERDPEGRELPGGSRQVEHARRGGDLVLTIDHALQYRAEQILTEEVTAANANGATAIVMDVQNGDILAMATVDGATKDAPAHPATAGEQNRPLTDVYEPGSTNKVLTVAAAIESGIVTPDTWFETPGQLVIDGTTFEDVEATHPSSMTVADIVRHSSNVGTIKIAQTLGKERFDAFLHAFGYGSPTGLDYPGESTGIVLPLDQYNDTSLASMPIGNGVAITPMQMLDVFTTIANGGMTRPPRLVAATVSANGTRREASVPASTKVVSPATAAAVSTMLEGVVQSGTGTNAAVEGYRVAGKTGTARKPPYDRPPYRYTSSFAGFAPASAPRLSAIVVFDEPHGDRGFLASRVAAPAFSRIMEAALRAERIPPDGTGTLPPTP